MEYLQILRDNWGYDSFRGIQAEIIESIGSGRDTLGLMPTGGGKSICFQVPTLAMDGLNIVITPLIALMRDQVTRLRMQGIKATAIHSGMNRDEVERAYDNCTYGNYKFLYISPERIGTETFCNRLTHFPHVCLITVDEAHCVSQWGYDFRPSYLKIAQLRHIIPYHVPILALTATATPQVIDDIQDRLEFEQKNVIAMSFERKNLAYIVRHTADKPLETVNILKRLNQGSAIVYTRSRRLTVELARLLNKNGISADNYHAGLNPTEKDHRQENWTKGRVRVMVATNAFGMGIDKADVRTVIHYNMPDSLESYFQEAGRAGRDGEKAWAVMLYNPTDQATIKRRINDNFPPKEYIRQTYNDMCNFLAVGKGEGYTHIYDFSLEKFCTYFHHFPIVANSALHILSNSGYIDYQEENDFKSKLKITLRKEELYQLGPSDTRSDTIIRAILRSYTGLFADYVNIDETYIAYATGYTPEAVYNTLKEMRARGIMAYIPRRNTPTIQFLTPRIDPERIALTPAVYDDRKQDYAQRAGQLLNYATNNNECRSVMLLRYFGQTQSKPCGQCDVCIERKRKPASEQTQADIRQKITSTLADNKMHSIDELQHTYQDRMLVEETVRDMLREEEIVAYGRNLKLNYKQQDTKHKD